MAIVGLEVRKATSPVVAVEYSRTPEYQNMQAALSEMVKMGILSAEGKKQISSLIDAEKVDSNSWPTCRSLANVLARYWSQKESAGMSEKDVLDVKSLAAIITKTVLAMTEADRGSARTDQNQVFVSLALRLEKNTVGSVKQAARDLCAALDLKLPKDELVLPPRTKFVAAMP